MAPSSSSAGTASRSSSSQASVSEQATVVGEVDSEQSENDVNPVISTFVSPPGVDTRSSWLVVFGSFVIHLCGLGMVYTFGVLLVPVAEHYKVGRGLASVVGSGLPAFMLTMGIPSGYMTDRFGFRLMIVVGGAFMSIGFLLSSISPNLPFLFFSYSFLIGTGVSFAFIPAISSVSQWFIKHRSFATGVAVAGSGAGNFVLPPIVTALLKSSDLATTFQVLALLGLIVSLCATVAKRRVVPLRTTAWGMFKDRNFQLLFGMAIFAGYGFLVPFVHLPAYAIDQGVDKEEAALLLSFMGGASLVGRIGLGFFADRIGRVRILQVSFITMALSTAVWFLLTKFWMLALYGVVFGFFAGGFISLLPGTIVDFWGLERLPSTAGLLYFGAAIGNVAGPTVTGFLFDVTDSYTLAILLTSATMVLAAVFLCLLPNPSKLLKEAEAGDDLSESEKEQQELDRRSKADNTQNQGHSSADFATEVGNHNVDSRSRSRSSSSNDSSSDNAGYSTSTSMV